MILCQFNGGCMGCCGHDYKNVKSVKEAIRKNTLEFKDFDDLEKFRDRAGKWDLRSGVCKNVIMVKGKVFCPLHPARNKGVDLRAGHCDVNYFCKTVKEFEKWNRERQKEFLDFLKKKKLGVIEYGIKIDDDSLLKEFLK
ncbi:hypothetical protein ACFLZB_02575 [Nanoarchaeota archaeon]